MITISPNISDARIPVDTAINTIRATTIETFSLSRLASIENNSTRRRLAGAKHHVENALRSSSATQFPSSVWKIE